MLFQQNQNGVLTPMAEPNWHARRLNREETEIIIRFLQDRVRAYNEDSFSAYNIVGEGQIDWEQNDALGLIIERYPISRRGQSSVLGRLLFQALWEDQNRYLFSHERSLFRANYQIFDGI